MIRIIIKKMIEEEKIYSLLDFTNREDIFDIIQSTKDVLSKDALQWPKFNTRYGSRHVNQIDIQSNDPIINEILRIANSTVETGVMIPIQMYVCYYKDGSQVTPMHSHPCRQLTLSFGTERGYENCK
jgi:D-lyxose ketol-isomerase